MVEPASGRAGAMFSSPTNPLSVRRGSRRKEAERRAGGRTGGAARRLVPGRGLPWGGRCARLRRAHTPPRAKGASRGGTDLSFRTRSSAQSPKEGAQPASRAAIGRPNERTWSAQAEPKAERNMRHV
eukprot:4535776-Pleurochrysis_carterae.AAC.8